MYRIIQTGVALAAPVFWLVLVASVAYSVEPLRVGMAAADITPPVGFRMSGYFYERSSTGTHDPLRAKAIVWQQGEVRFAWVFCDMLGITSEVTNVARTKAAEATGIPRENIFIAAIHSHTGPLLFGPLKDYFHEAAVKKNGSDPLEFAEYAAELPKKLVAAVQKAAAEMAPVDVSAGMCLQPGLAFNRR